MVVTECGTREAGMYSQTRPDGFAAEKMGYFSAPSAFTPDWSASACLRIRLVGRAYGLLSAAWAGLILYSVDSPGGVRSGISRFRYSWQALRKDTGKSRNNPPKWRLMGKKD